MTSDYTATGARRTGDRYQDVVAVEVFVQMLARPEEYAYVRLEAYDLACRLDDVVVVLKDGHIIAKQVKFSTDPDAQDDPWTWEDLTRQESGLSGPRKSLLQKWAGSVDKLGQQASTFAAEVVSNRSAAPDLAGCLQPDGFVDFVRIPDDIRDEVSNQIGGEAAARAFFARCEFKLDQPSLEELDHGVHEQFRRLGGTDEGWYRLKDEVGHWVCHKNAPPPDGKISVEDVKRAAEWRLLESLPQDFAVPADYVLPSKDFHESVLRRLQSHAEGCLLLTGSPGIGKSTYLSYLYAEIRRLQVPVVRHHYFLSLSRPSPGRFDHLQVASSLMHDLITSYPESLERSAYENPHPRDLHKWITKAGLHFKGTGQCLIVIIDGLDHVWREKSSLHELGCLLEHLLPIQDGILLILGSQPLPQEQLPSCLTRARPEVIDLPFLDEKAVETWVGHHREDLTLPDDKVAGQALLSRVTSALYKRSEGHPLHLVYTLRALLEQGIPVRDDEIERLPACSHSEISAYYQELWRTLDDRAREVLHLFAVCQFPWKSEWIVECLDPNGDRLADWNEAIRKTRHLLVNRCLGLQPFHSSILAFVSSLDEHVMFVKSLRAKVLKWLETSAPQYWRWAYEWGLKADCGDIQAIVNGPSRDWVITSIEHAYPDAHAADLLSRSAWIAINNRDLARAVEVGLLNDYLVGSCDSRSEALDQLLFAQIRIEKDTYLLPRLQGSLCDISEDALVHVAERASELRNQELVWACCEELYQAIFRTKRELGDVGGLGVSAAVDRYAKAAAYNDDSDTARVLDFAQRNRQSGHSQQILAGYMRGLRLARGVAKLRDVLSADLSNEERESILDSAVMLALDECVDIHDVLTPADASHPIVLIYDWITEFAHDTPPPPQDVPTPDWLHLKEYELYDRSTAIEASFRRIFFVFLANGLYGHEEANAAWLSRVGAGAWVSELLAALNRCACALAESLRNGDPPRLPWLYSQLADLPGPSFEDRAAYRYGRCAQTTIGMLALDLLSLNRDRGSRPISRDDLEEVFRSEYCFPSTWTRLYLDRRAPLLTDDAATWLLSTLADEVDASVFKFNERPDEYSVLAGVAAMHCLEDETVRFIRRTAENIVTHGDHKDTFLFGVLDAIRACGAAGVPDAREWLLDLAPVISRVGDFTDGDETGALPAELGSAMMDVAPHMLPRYHAWLIAQEEYADALSVFHAFLRRADLSLEFNRAAAGTAIDDEGMIILSDRALAGDIPALAVLSTIRDRFGHDDESIEEIRQSLRSYTTPASSDREPLRPDAFPPGRLTEYVAAANPQYEWERKDAVGDWIQHWVAHGECAGVYKDIQVLIGSGNDVGNEDAIFEMELNLHGRDAAYPSLVRAHSENHGWGRYWNTRDRSVRRWDAIKEHYPAKWYDFIVDTMISDPIIPWRRIGFHERFCWLIEYCVYQGHTDVATAVVRAVLGLVHELVSPITLPIPQWVNSR